MIEYNESDLDGLIDKIIIDPNELIYKIFIGYKSRTQEIIIQHYG